MPFIGFLLNFLNFKKIIPFLIENWKILMLVGMIGIIAYQNLSGTRFLFGAETIPSLERRLVEARVIIDTCKAGNDALSASIDKRNNEIQEWKNISNALENNIISLQDNLVIERTKTNIKVKSILTGKTPQSCKSAINYLREARGVLKWEK